MKHIKNVIIFALSVVVLILLVVCHNQQETIKEHERTIYEKTVTIINLVKERDDNE